MKTMRDSSRAPNGPSEPGTPASPRSRAKRARRGTVVQRVAPAGESGDRASLVKQAVDQLRRRILSIEGEDAFLGSEEELMAELGVSRPTFRQAARLLEHERLLKIRRGSGGGFFARAPTVGAVAHMAAIYLTAKGTNLRQINEAFGSVLIEAACLVTRDGSEATHRAVADFVAANAGFENAEDERDRVRVVLEFERLLASSCGNPAIALMVNVILALVRDPRYSQFRLTRERARQYAEFHRRLVEAIRLCDVEMARLFTRAHISEVSKWQGGATMAAP